MAAREHDRAYFSASPLASAEVAGPVIALGEGYESWLVKVKGASGALMVAVIVGPDGQTEVPHHVRLAA